jgi:tetratricopeptide (TPR) repeat protein
MTGTAQQAMELIRSGRREDARSLCESACKRNPADADAWFTLAGLHAQEGRLNEVVECCNKVIALQPGFHGAHYNLGVALQSLGRHHEAVDAYRKLLKLQPDSPQAHGNLALSLHMTGQFEAAEVAARKAVQLAPDFPSGLNNLGLILKDRGDLDAAIEALSQAIRHNPAFAQAHYNLGLCLNLGKRYAEAEASLREALRLLPNYPDAWNDLAAVLHAQERSEEAVHACMQALQQRPRYPEALNNLGIILLATDQIEQAEQRFREALGLRPDYASAHSNLGNLLVHQGHLDLAIEHYQKALKSRPDYAEALNNLGNAHMRQDRFDEAIPHLRKAVELKPDFAEALNNLGNALLSSREAREHYAEAEQAFRKAIESASDPAEYQINLGNCLHLQGKYEEALETFRQAERLKPGYPDAIAGQADLLEHIGEFEHAMALVQPLIDEGRDNLQIALAYGELARHSDCREAAITLLKKNLDDPDALTSVRMKAHFLLGKLYDELKDHEQAFTHYRNANDMDPIRFDRAKSEQHFDNFTSFFQADAQRKRPRASNKSRLPVFIVGMPRSGTSLVEQILSSHPDVHGAGELEDMHKLTQDLPGILGSSLPFPQCMAQIDRKALDILATKYLGMLSRLAPRALRVTDKMPHNFQALGLIELLFPNAQIIHCMRNPVDTCLSIYFQEFNGDHAYANDLAELGLYYRHYLRLMDHWRATLSVPILDIQYEDLVDDQETHSRRMIEFCGLKWDDACLSFHASKRVVKTPSYDQVRRPIYRKSVERWRNYEEHLGPLLEALGSDATHRRDPAIGG